MSSMPDWTSFRKRIYIEHPIENVYNSWAVPHNLTTWFLEKAEYFDQNNSLRSPNDQIQKGNRYSWKWHNWDIIEKGEVLIANGKNKIVFTFGSGGNVRVELTELNTGTELILIQEEIPTDEESKMNFFVGCSTGWTFWLANLKAWLEHGITLHATGLTQEETKDLVNS